MNDCLFCKIVAGEIPSTKVFEDDTTFAFLDISPTNHGHTLIIPKEHHANLYELPDELLSTLAVNTKKLATAVKKGVNADGINIIMNNDAPAGQVIFHAHIHIIPRFASDGFKHWKGKNPYAEGEAEIISNKIKSAL